MKYVSPAILNVAKADKVLSASRKVANFKSAKGDGDSDSQILPTRTVGSGYTANS
jgi:hypothetical protein